jgi:transketolase
LRFVETSFIERLSKEIYCPKSQHRQRGKKMSQNSAANSLISNLDQICVNSIRCLSIDAVQKANSGHPGLPLGAAPMAYVLWTRFLKHNPANPKWWDRDRFVLSAGHGSMLLYSLLYLTGYDLPLDQIQRFRQWESRTPGHPERGLVPGVETTTGPLGQGFANGIGMAIAEAYMAARYNRPGHEIVNHYTYAIVSDGDLMEGISYEAASLAGHLKLGKLIYLYDDNRISLAASTEISFTENRSKYFEALGWHTVIVEDGNDLKSIEAAIRAAQAERQRPSLILVRTLIGFGSPHKQGTFESHGSPLGAEEVKLTKQNLGWPAEPEFYVPEEALKFFRKAIDCGKEGEAEWSGRFEKYSKAFPDLAQGFQQLMRGELPKNWEASLPSFPADAKGMATRAASGKVINAIAPALPALIGGSADLNPSTQTVIKNAGDFENPDYKPTDTQGATGGGWGYQGRNLHFGVREHAMGSIANGMGAHGGIIPFTATFFVFSDYMRPSIRLASLMELGVIFIFTHDSIGVGEDGPTHQPVEHLAALRAIPGLTVIRPCDANETAEAWRIAIQSRCGPVALVLTRQELPTLDRARYASAEGLKRGAYVLADTPGRDLELILVASGSEVALIVAAQQKLAEQGIAVRTVSMPSWELFDAQPQEYRNQVFRPSIRARLAVEAGVPQGWHKYVGENGDVIGLNRFGASAPAKIVFGELGFTVDNIVAHSLKLVGK